MNVTFTILWVALILRNLPGAAVEPYTLAHNWKLLERSKLSVIYACTKCEHVQEGQSGD